MPTTFTEPIEPYDVDPADKAAMGRLMHAGARGDSRAKLTLRKIAEGKQAPRGESGQPIGPLTAADQAAQTLGIAGQSAPPEHRARKGSLQQGSSMFDRAHPKRAATE